MPKKEEHGSAIIRDVILGGQDGLVNVLGIVLAVATATASKYIIFISGLAATFAESISMAAVAYTSAKAGKEYYRKKRREIENSTPTEAKRALKGVFTKCGLEGTLLNKAITSVMKSERLLRQVWIAQEAEHAEEFEHPIRDAIVVGFAALLGSVVPLIAFIYTPVATAVWLTVIISMIALFVSGMVKANYTGVDQWKSGFEMAVVGITAALAGYFIGILLGAIPV